MGAATPSKLGCKREGTAWQAAPSCRLIYRLHSTLTEYYNLVTIGRWGLTALTRIYSWLKWVSLTVLLLGFVVPVFLTWFTELASIETAAHWLHDILADWVADAAARPKMAQWRTLLLLGLPVSALCFIFALIGHVGERGLTSGMNQELDRLTRQLERFLLVYDPNWDFMGRLQRLANQYNHAAFQEFRQLVYQCVYEYCGALEVGKETFLVMPSANDGGEFALSVRNWEVREAILSNLTHIGVCRTVLHSGTPQLVNNTSRAPRQTMTLAGWILPECQSILVCPIQVGSAMQGLIGVYHTKPNAFTEDGDKIFLELMAELLSLAYTLRSKEVGL